MKRILVLYYTQTGQLADIVNSLLEPLKKDAEVAITMEAIVPENDYPFPWSKRDFFEVFPESVLDKPCAIKPLQYNIDEHYDLVILAYQVWYLSPSIPVTAFLQSNRAKKLFATTPVITVIGCRNMWIMAQEKVRNYVKQAGGKIVGNIVLVDRTPNLISIITISAWMLKGIKKRFMGIFPDSGVSDKDIKGASLFGESILEKLKSDDFSTLQQQLIKQKAVRVKPSLMGIEQRAIRIFGLWANFVSAKGEYKDPARTTRIRIFSWYLPIAIAILLLIVFVLTSFIQLLTIFKTKKQIAYYSN
jgi:hypothetical protein